MFCKGTMMKKSEAMLLFMTMWMRTQIKGLMKEVPYAIPLFQLLTPKTLESLLIPLFLSFPIPIHEENPICSTYNTHIQNLSTSHLLHCCPLVWATTISCRGHWSSCLAGLPAFTFKYPLSIIKQNNLLNQHRTFCHSTENPTMPHPLPFRLKALVITCTRHYSLQPPLGEFISYSSAPCLLSSSSHTDSHTLERLPLQDICIGCLFYPEHSFLRQLPTATTQWGKQQNATSSSKPSGFSWHYVCPCASTHHANHGVSGLALPPLNPIQTHINSMK